MKRVLLFLVALALFSLNPLKQNTASKIIMNGDVLLYESSNKAFEIDNDSKVHTAYIELEYNTIELQSVERKPTNHKHVNENYFDAFNLQDYYDVYILDYIPLIILVTNNDIEDLIFDMENIENYTFIQSILIQTEYSVVNNSGAFDPWECAEGIPCGTPGGGYPYEGLGEVPESHGILNVDVKIGILEKYAPYFLNENLNALNWKIKMPDYVRTGEHATLVVKTLADELTNSNDVAFFAANALHPYQAMDAISWMISQGVHIINISLSINDDYYYSTLQKYIDYIAAQNQVLFVSAVSNILPYINGFALTYNGVAVGSITQAKEYTNESAYNELFNISKPNFVDNYYIKINKNDDEMGTSFATPRVAAKVADLLLLEPQLKNNLSLLLSIMHTAASRDDIQFAPTNYDTSGFEDKIGVGIFDYDAARYIYNNNMYHIAPKQYYCSGSLIYEKTVYIPQNKKLIASASQLVQIRKDGIYYNAFNLCGLRLEVWVDNVCVVSSHSQNIVNSIYLSSYNKNATIKVYNINNIYTTDTEVVISWRIK